METSGQYKTKNLKVTKSYIEYKNKRIEMSDIVEAHQPQNDPRYVAFFVAIASAALVYALLRSSITAGIIVVIAAIGVLWNVTPVEAVIIKTKDNKKHPIIVTKEKNKEKAIKTILDNVEEYQNKSRPLTLDKIERNGNDIKITPEEHVRQYVLRLLKTEFQYPSSDIGYEFPIQLGSSQKRADVVIFTPDKPHLQENISIIIECKRADIKNDKSAIEQLKSYMAASLNAKYGVVASHRWRVIENTGSEFHPIPALPSADGEPHKITYEPGNNTIFSDIGVSTGNKENEQSLKDMVTGAIMIGVIIGSVLALVT